MKEHKSWSNSFQYISIYCEGWGEKTLYLGPSKSAQRETTAATKVTVGLRISCYVSCAQEEGEGRVKNRGRMESVAEKWEPILILWILQWTWRTEAARLGSQRPQFSIHFSLLHRVKKNAWKTVHFSLKAYVKCECDEMLCEILSLFLLEFFGHYG